METFAALASLNAIDPGLFEDESSVFFIFEL